MSDGIDITCFEDDAECVRRVEALKARLHTEPSETESYYSRENPFFRHGRVKSFLASRDGVDIGAVSAIEDDLLPSELGLVGLFECENDTGVAHALLREACAHLKARGKSTLKGPIDLGVWNRFRFKVDHFNDPTYMGEPQNPAYYPELWERFGFTEDARWKTWRFTREQANAMLPLFGYGEDPFDSSWELRPVTEPTEEYATAFFEQLMQSFAGNYLVTPIDRGEYDYLFAHRLALLPLMHLSLVYDPAGKLRGMSFLHPDFSEAFRATGGKPSLQDLVQVAEKRELCILNAYSLDRSCRASGLFRKLVFHSIRPMVELGYKAYLPYLVRPGKTVFDNLGDDYASYCVYRLSREE